MSLTPLVDEVFSFDSQQHTTKVEVVGEESK